MKIILISDTHTMHDQVNLPDGEFDLLLHAGDLTYDGDLACLKKFDDWCGKVKDRFKYGIVIIAGNHDLTLDPRNLRYKKHARDMFTNSIYLDDSGVEINGLKIWGSPIQPWFCNWAFNRERGEDIKRHWDLIPDGTDILITHGPPFGVLDHPFGRQPSVGCEELMKAIMRIQPKLNVFGHIHGGYGIEKIGPTTFVNASVCTESYDPINPPIVVEL